MTADPTGWPDAARDAVVRAIEPPAFRAVVQIQNNDWFPGTLPLAKEQAALALAALAPFVAAALAQARREGMEQAADFLRDYACSSGVTHKNVLHSLFRAEAALRAKAQEAGDE